MKTASASKRKDPDALGAGVRGICKSPGLRNQPEKCSVTIPNVATFTSAQRAEGQLTAAVGSVTAEPKAQRA